VGAAKVHHGPWSETALHGSPVGVWQKESGLILSGGCHLSLSKCKGPFHSTARGDPEKGHFTPQPVVTQKRAVSLHIPRCTITAPTLSLLPIGSDLSPAYPSLYKYSYFQPIHHHTYLPMKMEPTQSSETSAYKIKTPGNYREESTLHPQHGESLKATIVNSYQHLEGA
jgi:hypothetical protein